MKSVLLFVLLGIGFGLQAQDLTGIWRGNFKKNTCWGEWAYAGPVGWR